jgi:hypothetical protein
LSETPGIDVNSTHGASNLEPNLIHIDLAALTSLSSSSSSCIQVLNKLCKPVILGDKSKLSSANRKILVQLEETYQPIVVFITLKIKSSMTIENNTGDRMPASLLNPS